MEDYIQITGYKRRRDSFFGPPGLDRLLGKKLGRGCATYLSLLILFRFEWGIGSHGLVSISSGVNSHGSVLVARGVDSHGSISM